MLTLDNLTAVIIGGGQGIGLATATVFKKLGARVVIGDISTPEHRAASEEIGAEFIGVDVREADLVNDCFDYVGRSYGKLDVSVHCAGARLVKAAEQTSDTEWQELIDVNLNGMFRCCRAAGNLMIKAQHGSIINVASMSATAVNKPQQQVAYNSSKAGVVMMTRSLASYWGRHGIRVNCVSPGYTKTAMTEGGRSKSDWVDAWMDHTPLGRIAEPSEIAWPIAFLASECSSYITGHDLLIDGGYTCY